MQNENRCETQPICQCRDNTWNQHERVKTTIETTLKMDSYIIKLVQNGPKWLETVKNYRKWVKNFKKI